MYARATDSIVDAVTPVQNPLAVKERSSAEDIDSESSGTDITVGIQGTRR